MVSPLPRFLQSGLYRPTIDEILKEGLYLSHQFVAMSLSSYAQLLMSSEIIKINFVIFINLEFFSYRNL